MSSPYRICDADFTGEKSGLLTARVVYLVPGPAAPGDTEPWEVLSSYEGESAPLGLPILGRSASKDKDGDWLLTLEYQGISGEVETFAEVEWSYSKGTAPLTQHPKFSKAVMSSNFGAIFDDEQRFVGFKPVYDPSRDAPLRDGVARDQKNPWYGVDSFLQPRPQLSATYLTKSWPDMRALANLGKIDSPVTPGEPTPTFDTPEGKSWLKSAVTANYKGNIWQVRVTWELGVWLEYLYAPE